MIDLLTGTTGDTLVEGAALDAWVQAREGLNRWLQDLAWPELAPCNLTQKLMDDQRCGREAQFAALHDVHAMNEIEEGRLAVAPALDWPIVKASPK